MTTLIFSRSRFFVASASFAVCVLTGCGRLSQSHSTVSGFLVTNEVVGGEVKEVLSWTNGVSLSVSDSNVVLWIGDESNVMVEYDKQTQTPLQVFLTTYSLDDGQYQHVADLDADGVPDVRQLEGDSRKQLFYKGEWYDRQLEGDLITILVNGDEVPVHFDGRRWVEVGGAPN